MKFVKNYKLTRKRMNWCDCHAQLEQTTDVIKYKKLELLRVQLCYVYGALVLVRDIKDFNRIYEHMDVFCRVSNTKLNMEKILCCCQFLGLLAATP